MTAVGELVLVLGLLVSAHCEVRARDPEVEEEEEELGGRGGGGGGGGGVFPLYPGATKATPLGETGNYPARSGNWCAFVHKRVATMAVMCGTEKYTIKSQSPCPSGMADCHLTMYKLSTRPMYKQQQKIFTTLLWRCCPGHGGHNCEDTVSGPQVDSESSPLIGQSEAETAAVKAPVVHTRFQQQGGDLNREQNDHQVPVSAPYNTSYQTNQHNPTDPTPSPGHTHNHHTSHQEMNTHNHHQHPHRLEHDPRQHDPRQHEHRTPDDLGAAPLPYPDALIPLLVPYMMDQVWSQLQPVMEGFNRSLEHLSRQVGDLAHDVAQLKSSQLGAGHQVTSLKETEHDVEAEDARLDEVSRSIGEVRRQMEAQQTEMEKKLHLHNMMLTSFKTDMDMKLKRQQKMLQVSLQAMNATLMELKLDQWQIPEDELEQDDLHPPTLPPHQLLQAPTDTSALWEAIKRLDNTVVNNTVKVTALMEDVEVSSGSVQQLSQHIKELEKLINQTARRSQVLFMETGLEVEGAKVVVLNQVNELARNLSQQVQQLQAVEDDFDYLWKNMSCVDCDYKGLKAAMAHLEKQVANAMEQANENRLALEENSRGGYWGMTSDWEPAVKALQLGLQREQNSIRSLDLSLTQLKASVSSLNDTDRQQDGDIKVLAASFDTLLQDANRHSRVLTLLLGEEVLDFLKTTNQGEEDEEEEEEEEVDLISVPVLKDQLQFLQEQLRQQKQSIMMLQHGSTGGREEVPAADQPSSWLPDDTRRHAREQQMLFHPGDGGDLWNLERTVEEMERRLAQLEEEPCPCPNISTTDTKVQEEVMWLKRGLEQHLTVFKNVFRNADVLMRSDATLELDKLWQLLKTKEKKRGQREESGRGGKPRSRRESPGEPIPSSLSERSLLFVAQSPRSVSSGIAFEPSLSQGQFYSNDGTFTAPVDGMYLFVLTLHLRPGPAHVVLRRRKGEEEGGASVSLQRQEVSEEGPVTAVSLLRLRDGEQLRLELRGGEWAESEDNLFAGLLLHPTT
ncbi:multimerin-2a [Archocentrus centrarchus]|uniref:multimerin-2a n=1 Tax=Archocentrus centrarchus TaxID=63155 RepID=UPI0011EA280C|nr:multimerin-2 [Archocentrus centrarchus]